MDLESAIYDAISRICEIPVDQIQRESRLAEIGVDSLASAEIITDVEMRVGRDLPGDVLRRLGDVTTVGDVVRLVEGAFATP